MTQLCKSIGCCNAVVGHDFCDPCQNKEASDSPGSHAPLAERYPNQYKSVGDLTEIDAFAVHHIFQLQDPSGCLQHASRKLLAGGKPVFRDIREARDTLTRWLQLNQELVTS